MKKVTVANYKKDTFYPKVVRAFDILLEKKEIVSPVEVFLTIGNLTPQSHKDWITGKAPYLERVIQGNLSKFSRVLRIIGFHAHDLNMVPVSPTYSPYIKGTKKILIYSKSKDKNVDASYKKCFKWNRKLSYIDWKQENE